MEHCINPVIHPVLTGKNLSNILKSKKISVKQLQMLFGFEYPQAVYSWLSGRTLPNIDNFLKLSKILDTKIEEILIYEDVR